MQQLTDLQRRPAVYLHVVMTVHSPCLATSPGFDQQVSFLWGVAEMQREHKASPFNTMSQCAAKSTPTVVGASWSAGTMLCLHACGLAIGHPGRWLGWTGNQHIRTVACATRRSPTQSRTTVQLVPLYVIYCLRNQDYTIFVNIFCVMMIYLEKFWLYIHVLEGFPTVYVCVYVSTAHLTTTSCFQ